VSNLTSPIQWTDATWSPVVGCKRVSRGCDHCYAFELHDRRYVAWKRGSWPSAPAQYHQPFSRVRLLPERLAEPRHWRKPRRVFVNSMSDLFHEDVPDEFIDRVLDTVRATPQHTYQVLTKRPERLAAYVRHWRAQQGDMRLPGNLWLGVSVEDQAAAEERIPLLVETPAAVRFLSCEPLLSMVNLERWLGVRVNEPECPWEPATYERKELSGLAWVIIGGESGRHARPMRPEWAQDLIDQCRAANVPVFMKQMGSVWARAHPGTDSHGGTPGDWPEHLRVREFPAGA
jgi:protein gp37